MKTQKIATTDNVAYVLHFIGVIKMCSLLHPVLEIRLSKNSTVYAEAHALNSCVYMRNVYIYNVLCVAHLAYIHILTRI